MDDFERGIFNQFFGSSGRPFGFTNEFGPGDHPASAFGRSGHPEDVFDQLER